MVYYRDEQIDDAFFALSHPVRRAVLDTLSQGEHSVADVSEPFGLSAAQMTKHLAILERGGLLKRNKQGRTHYLQLQPDMLEEVMAWVQRYQKFWDKRLNALEHFLDNNNQSDNE
ncbi:MAG: ArsR/SmtB family transcription factor [Cellvibrionaceae bacterium]